MQPLDMGIIKNWKGHYRSQLARRVIFAVVADQDKQALDVVKSISLLDALYLAKEAWDLVSPEIIKNIFSKGGFYNSSNTIQEHQDSLEDISLPVDMTQKCT